MLTQQVKQMLCDEDAVAPVIGVVLMIGVTLAIGAVVGAFVFGIGDSLNQPPPEAAVDTNYNATESSLEMRHGGGELLTPSNTGLLRVTGDSTSPTWGGDDEDTQDKFDDDGNEATLNERIEAGDTILTIGIESGEQVRLIWVSPDGDNSETLSDFTAP